MLNTSEIETILGTFSHIKGCSMKLQMYCWLYLYNLAKNHFGKLE